MDIIRYELKVVYTEYLTPGWIHDICEAYNIPETATIHDDENDEGVVFKWEEEAGQ